MKRALVILFLLLIPLSIAEAKSRYFHKFISKSWTKTTGWCFGSKWRELPEWFKLRICVPRRWGAADVCIMEKIKINKRMYFMVGHKITYSKFRYEFMKKREEWANGPYVYFYMKF